MIPSVETWTPGNWNAAASVVVLAWWVVWCVYACTRSFTNRGIVAVVCYGGAALWATLRIVDKLSGTFYTATEHLLLHVSIGGIWLSVAIQEWKDAHRRGQAPERRRRSAVQA